MKRYGIVFASAALLLLGVACENQREETKDTDVIYYKEVQKPQPQPKPDPAPVARENPADNYIDAGGMRQGHWVITGRMTNDGTFGVDARVEEGSYVNGLRHGVWTTYNPDGSVRATVTYDMGMIVR